MILSGLELKAGQFARIRHSGQLDDEGKEYFMAHLLPVAEIIDVIVPKDVNLICAAYLHDTIEDTNTTYEELIKEFNQDIADLVMEVTHEGSKEKGYYFPRLHSKRGIMLKFADRLSNMSRMNSWNEKRQQHYLKRSKFWKTNS